MCNDHVLLHILPASSQLSEFFLPNLRNFGIGQVVLRLSRDSYQHHHYHKCERRINTPEEDKEIQLLGSSGCYGPHNSRILPHKVMDSSPDSAGLGHSQLETSWGTQVGINGWG